MYRIKQFFQGMFARLTKEDKAFVDKYLTDYEKALFYMLPASEQLHCVKVARLVLQELQKLGDRGKAVRKETVVKAALLHDVGKVQSGLNIFSKSILVIMDRFCPDILKKVEGLKTVHAYYHHPEIAADLLRDSDEGVKYYILNHHNYKLDVDEILKIIQNADSRN